MPLTTSLSRPGPAERFEIPPGLHRGTLRAKEMRDLPRGRAGRRIGRPGLHHRHAALGQIVQNPARVEQCFKQIQKREPRRQAKPIAHVALALGQNRVVDGQHQGRKAGVTGAANEIIGDFRIARGIDLEPGICRIDARNPLDRHHAGAGHDERDAGVRGGLREHQFGVAPKNSGHTGWGNAKGRGIAAAEQHYRLIALGDIDQMPRQQAVLSKRCLIAQDPALAFDAAENALVKHARQPSFGEPLDVANAERAGNFHRSPCVSWGRASTGCAATGSRGKGLCARRKP